MKNITSENTSSQEKEENNSAYSKNTELLQRIELEDTPFKMIGNETDGWVGTLGKYRLTEPFEEKEQLEKYLQKNNNWELLCNVISIMVKETLNAQAEEAMKELTEGINNETAE